MEKLIQKQRAKFITFWLWLCIVVNVISLTFSLISLPGLSNLGCYGMELITKGVDITPFSSVMSLNVLLLQVIAVIHSFVSIYGCVLLLKWNRSGFYIILSLQPIVSLVQAYGFYLVQQEYLQLGLSVYPMAAIAATIIMTIISIAILFGILQLRKNGVSYWSQLNQTVPTVNKVILETPTIQTAHKSQSNQASQTEQKTLISQEPATIDRANFKWGEVGLLPFDLCFDKNVFGVGAYGNGKLSSCHCILYSSLGDGYCLHL